MKIVSFTAENVKKLKAVTITPAGSVVQITGANGSGKSSVLDSIYYALAGTKDIPSQPIRKGEDKAHIRLDLGEVVVTRKFTGESSSLTVEAASGARFPSPQRMLDDLLGTLTFDPLEFSRMEPKKQLDTLRGMVKLEVDIDALDGLNKTDYDKRTDLNRDAKSLRAQADGITIPANTPEKEVDVSGIVKELEAAGEQNVLLERRKANREETRKDAERLLKEVEGLTNEIKDLDSRVADLTKRAEDKHKEALEMEEKLKNAEPLPQPADTAELQQRIAAASDVNKAVGQRQRKTELAAKAEGLEKQATECTGRIEARTQERTKAIESASMPVAGLAFGAGEVLYNDLPFSQASSAEQLRVSVGIAMAANPKLRVLRIKDGSLLDESNLALIAGMADDKDYQVWIERVDTSGKVGVVMEDGEVKAPDEPKKKK